MRLYVLVGLGLSQNITISESATSKLVSSTTAPPLTSVIQTEPTVVPMPTTSDLQPPSSSLTSSNPPPNSATDFETYSPTLQSTSSPSSTPETVNNQQSPQVSTGLQITLIVIGIAILGAGVAVYAFRTFGLKVHYFLTQPSDAFKKRLKKDKDEDEVLPEIFNLTRNAPSSVGYSNDFIASSPSNGYIKSYYREPSSASIVEVSRK